ncbi:MAG: metallopeptidase TldD-related protein [Bryobacteraceae bacterium]|nr:metallopeptidase TldD-related protein [Bryobacteraceae bacterium]
MLGAVLLPAQNSTPTTPLLEILSAELERNFSGLKEKADPAPYYIAYTVTEREQYTVAATQGALQDSSKSHSRVLDVAVRTGSPQLDNYHSMPGERPQFTSASLISLEDNPDAIRRDLWLATDRTYRLGAQRLIKIKTGKEVQVAREDQSDDFSLEPGKVAVAAPAGLKFSPQEWEPRVKRLSAIFLKHPSLLASSITLSVQREAKTFANTEGTRLHHGRGFARLFIAARAKAADGMDLGTFDSFEAEDPSRLPAEDVLRAAVEKVAGDLTRLLNAPVVEPFAGPAILSGRAAGVFFHEIFGHRIEGHRQKDEADGQTFTKSVNERVLPEFLTVTFDPTRRREGNVDLNGWYTHDDEGVAARPVPVVEKGVLKTFLMSRSPIKGFPRSNGHGRKQPGAEPVARQSNLIVESSKRVTEAKLRELLVEEIKRQNKPYGFLFEQVSSGVTTTGRQGFQAFKVVPLVVYRVYADGRPDELVRGVDIVGTPLSSFARIVATSDQAAVFNGYCGAESGSVPVSAVAPSILVSEIEVQKTEKSQDRPPLLSRPVAGGRS